MTQEEKAKLYDELKVKAQELAEDGYIDKLALVDMFPELKKSRDEMIRQLLISFVKYDMPDNYSDDISKEECLAWLEKQCEKGINGNEKEFPFSEQKPAWSEEDEKIYQSIMDDIVQENQLDGKQTDWLRDIKYRYFPQPKQEWSEEDEDIRNELIKHFTSLLECIATEERHMENRRWLNWLKSLRPQNTWKPSCEQINTFRDAIAYVEGCNSNFKGCGSVLEKLYSDLKKLRWE